MISVIIPSYNSDEFVNNAIESVLNQTYVDYEIILVDNNSSDNTVEILNKYLLKYPGKIKIFHEYKKGAPAARNKGLQQAKGEWTQFLDSDDELLPDKLETQIKIAENSNFDVIIGGCYIHNIEDNKLNKSIRKLETKNVWEGLLLSRLGVTSANLWRRKALLNVNGWDEHKSSSQEYDLLFRMMKNNENIGFCTTPLTIVNKREDSIHRSKNINKTIEVRRNYINLRVDIREYLKSKGKLTEELEHIANEFIYSCLIYSKEHASKNDKRLMKLENTKTLKELHLKLSSKYIFNFYLDFYKKKIKKILSRKN